MARGTQLLLAAVLLFASASPAWPAEPASLTLAEADERLAVAERLVEGGIFDRAGEIARSVLDDPAAQALTGGDEATLPWRQRREKARFLHDRARLGTAQTRDEFIDAAESFVQLFDNRYRLPDPAYAAESAYWAGRGYEAAGEYRGAADRYSRVGGINLPQGMEGDAARRLSACLRKLAEELPYPGSLRDRRRRETLISQAISELDRARYAFPVGQQRKAVELELLALRLARREEVYVREAANEAEAFIESDPSRDELRARATLYRGQAAAILGDAADAVEWFRRVVETESPTDDDRRAARLGLVLALLETAVPASPEERRRLLNQAVATLDEALAGTMSPGPWDGARIIKAEALLELAKPTAALEALAPILGDDRVNHRAWFIAGLAERRRGRLGEALLWLYPPSRPSNPARDSRLAAIREASASARARRDYALSLALNHHASQILRDGRLFASLLVSEFAALELNLRLGKMGSPVSLSDDAELLAIHDYAPLSAEDGRREAHDVLGRALGAVFKGGGDPDTGYDLAIAAESAHGWSGPETAKLDLAVAMISHLRKRQPAGITDSVLSSRLGEAKQALAMNRARTILAAEEPDETLIDRTLGDFAAAAASYSEAAAAGGAGRADNLDQGLVNLESGAFLLGLADRWDGGRWAGHSTLWREEARRRMEASLRPFNQTIATSGPASIAARRAKWSRGRAFELLGEWRGAASDFLSLMSNSELPRLLRTNAARRWAVCMRELGESRQALLRLGVFADHDAEAALLYGKLAEEAGSRRDAHLRYLHAADPGAPALPPATPWRAQEAAYRAARLALAAPEEINPLLEPDATRGEARLALERAALDTLDGGWTAPILELLGDELIGEGAGGRRRLLELAKGVLERTDVPRDVARTLHFLAARALSSGGEYAPALDELDAARDLLDGEAGSRRDAARITLETARVYRLQGRADDALRAYADVFAAHPREIGEAEAARVEAARMLLSSPASGDREREQARNILSGLRDRMQAENVLREYGIH